MEWHRSQIIKIQTKSSQNSVYQSVLDGRTYKALNQAEATWMW